MARDTDGFSDVGAVTIILDEQGNLIDAICTERPCARSGVCENRTCFCPGYECNSNQTCSEVTLTCG
jgi:hypothetical protein